MWGEVDWLATDRFGRVGQFSTAGFGPVPAILCRHADQLFQALDRLQAVRLGPESDTRLNDPHADWIRTAKLGLFGFDWDYKRSFVKHTIPRVPRLVDEFPQDIGFVCRLVRLESDFALTHRIRGKDIATPLVWGDETSGEARALHDALDREARALQDTLDRENESRWRPR